MRVELQDQFPTHGPSPLLRLLLHHLVRIRPEDEIADAVGSDLMPAVRHTLGNDGNVAGLDLLQYSPCDCASVAIAEQCALGGFGIDHGTTGDHGAFAGDDVVDLVEVNMGDRGAICADFLLAALDYGDAHVFLTDVDMSGDNVTDGASFGKSGEALLEDLVDLFLGEEVCAIGLGEGQGWKECDQREKAEGLWTLAHGIHLLLLLGWW